MRKIMLMAALVAMVSVSTVNAGWRRVAFVAGSSDYVHYQVSTKVGQDFFTICKANGSYRIYITFQGVGYEEFVSTVISWKSSSRVAPPTPPITGGSQGSLTSIALTDEQMFKEDGGINFSVFLADRFTRNGKRPKVSVVVMPLPSSNAHSGGNPAVEVLVNNCDIAGVRVVYSPFLVNGRAQVEPSNKVTVKTGTQLSLINNFGHNYGNVGTIHVFGGVPGANAITGSLGTFFSQARVCTIKPEGTPQKVLQGGSLGDALTTIGGSIGRISARNGLVGNGGNDAAKRIVSGYNAVTKLQSGVASIGQIIVKRGWSKPCVVAGSDYNGQFDSTVPKYYNGGISLFRINNKGDGKYTDQTGGVFTSAVAPRVVGKKKGEIDGNTIYVQRWGKTELSKFVK